MARREEKAISNSGELVVQDGFLFRGDRLVIPKTLRKSMLQKLHSSHQSIESTLRHAREIIYWPNMKSDIQDFTSKCETCATYSTKQRKETLISHDIPDRPWAKYPQTCSTLHMTKLSRDNFYLSHKNWHASFSANECHKIWANCLI